METWKNPGRATHTTLANLIVDDQAAKAPPHLLPRCAIENNAGAYSTPPASLSSGFFSPKGTEACDSLRRNFKKINKLPRFHRAGTASPRSHLARKYRRTSILQKSDLVNGRRFKRSKTLVAGCVEGELWSPFAALQRLNFGS